MGPLIYGKAPCWPSYQTDLKAMSHSCLICVSSHFLENEKDPASASAHSQLLQVFWLRSWKIEWEMSKVRYRETKAKSIIVLPLILGKDVQGDKLQHCACMCPMIRQFFHSGGRATSGRSAELSLTLLAPSCPGNLVHYPGTWLWLATVHLHIWCLLSGPFDPCNTVCEPFDQIDIEARLRLIFIVCSLHVQKFVLIRGQLTVGRP